LVLQIDNGCDIGITNHWHAAGDKGQMAGLDCLEWNNGMLNLNLCNLLVAEQGDKCQDYW
jgi:hypothetical protein